MRTYRVAIVGCRARGAATGHAYHAHPRAEVVALCDLMRERVDELGDALGVAARYDDLDAMIERERPDIVAIATATESHYDLLSRVLEHGVHVDVEKPMCLDLEQADAIMARRATGACASPCTNSTAAAGPLARWPTHWPRDASASCAT